MNLFGLSITRTKAPVPVNSFPPSFGSGPWIPIVREPFAGAWQRNIETPICDVLAHPTVFACVTLIAGDIAKTRWELVELRGNDVWTPTESPAFSPVLRKPNGVQVPFQFRQHWTISKLTTGNTYALKQRDERGVVVGLYVLDPYSVRVLVSEDGGVFYHLSSANDTNRLAGLELGGVVVPAREIIHDLFNPLWHPLMGVSPLYAAGVAAMLGVKIQNNSATFFENGAQPGGILSAPKSISKESAERLKAQWHENYGGINAGKVAVLGDDLKYQSLAQPAKDSELSEQWKSASEAIAAAFHVPWYRVGGPAPAYNNVQALDVQYYTQCLQPLMTQLEDVLDYGLGLGDKIEGRRLGVQFVISDLLLMDSMTQINVIREGVSAGVLAPNEGRARINLPPVEGGETPYLQQQNYSLAALHARDELGPVPPTPAPAPVREDEEEPDDEAFEDDEDDEELDDEEVEAGVADVVRKGLGA